MVSTWPAKRAARCADSSAASTSRSGPRTAAARCDTKPISAFSSATWKLLLGGRNCIAVTVSPDDTLRFCS